LIEPAAAVSSPPPPAPKGSRRVETLLAIGIVVMVANIAVMATLVHELTKAKTTMNEAHDMFAQAKEFMDFPSRLLHGSLPNVVNNLVQTDYGALSRNTTKLSTAVQNMFDSFGRDDGMMTVARYSSLVTSVARKVGLLAPRWTPIVPKPSDDEGVVNVFSYLSDWATQQLDRTSLMHLGSSCTAFLDAALNVDWSDTYVWNLGRDRASWDVNQWKNTMADVYQYCDRISKLPPSWGLDDDTTLPDVVTPDDTPSVSPSPSPSPPPRSLPPNLNRRAPLPNPAAANHRLQRIVA